MLFQVKLVTYRLIADASSIFPLRFMKMFAEDEDARMCFFIGHSYIVGSVYVLVSDRSILLKLPS